MVEAETSDSICKGDRRYLLLLFSRLMVSQLMMLFAILHFSKLHAHFLRYYSTMIVHILVIRNIHQSPNDFIRLYKTMTLNSSIIKEWSSDSLYRQ